MAETRLECLTPESAQAVATEAAGHEPHHCAHAEGTVVILTYDDKRYPLDVAEWAFGNGHAADAAAAAVIGAL